MAWESREIAESVSTRISHFAQLTPTFAAFPAMRKSGRSDRQWDISEMYKFHPVFHCAAKGEGRPELSQDFDQTTGPEKTRNSEIWARVEIFRRFSVSRIRFICMYGMAGLRDRHAPSSLSVLVLCEDGSSVMTVYFSFRFFAVKFDYCRGTLAI